MLTPIGSVAISGRPVFETSVSISSGNASRSRLSTSVACWIDSSSDTLGSRRIWIARAPSSSRGMNSAPRSGTTATVASDGNARRSPSTGGAVARDHASTGS